MTKTLIALAIAAAYLLYMSGIDQPDWLPYAIFGLLTLTICILGVCLADATSIKNDPINPALDEHRDNSI